MIRAEKMILEKTDQMAKWLSEAAAIYNQALFHLRQEYFDAKATKQKPCYQKINLYELSKMSDFWNKSDLDYNAKQYVLKKVNDNWKSFCKACSSYHKDRSKFLGMPRIPNYLKYGKTAILVFDKSRFRNKDFEKNTLCLPKSEYSIQIPKSIQMQSIKCITVKSYYGKIKLCISYEKEVKNKKKLNQKNCLGIDLGVNNIAAITTNNQIERSWIVKGGCIKSINQFYNKRLGQMKSILETVNDKKTSKAIQKLSMKRNHKLDYEFHCLSKRLVQLCVDNGIGTMVIGHNKNWKQKSNMKKATNQKFVSIPFNDLIFKLQYKCEEQDIRCLVTEESYTSKIDHCVREEMKHQDSYKGKRIKRGRFVSSCGKVLNADINGAIGILRKVNAFSDADFISLRDRGDVVSPMVLRYKP